MYFFDKKVEYLVWKMAEGHARGVGTVKLLAMDDVCRMELQVTGCGKVQGSYPVYLLSGDMQSLLGEITLQRGKGSLFLKGSTQALGDMRFPYEMVTGVHIDLKTEGCLEQKWLPLQTVKKETVSVVKETKKETEQEEVKPPEAQPEEVKLTETKPENAVTEHRSEKQQPTFPLYPMKWKQLCAIYPVVHPFQDGRAYLSIEPRDFVILQERFQPLVENSFLLHGFYHYRHLLLGRSVQGKTVQYYLGVPGVFYEKEKAAALFYGFESFEGAQTPAPQGSFGYYMKRVQL